MWVRGQDFYLRRVYIEMGGCASLLCGEKQVISNIDLLRLEGWYRQRYDEGDPPSLGEILDVINKGQYISLDV